jgi:HSP20 family protein
VAPAWGTTTLPTLLRDVDRLFEDVLRGFDASRGAGRAAFAPDVDVEETETEFRVTADLPGLEEKNVDVSIEGEVLTISGERQADTAREERGHRHTERSYGKFQRSIPLPESADVSKATARFAKGVLTVTVPKAAEAPSKRRKIEVTSA